MKSLSLHRPWQSLMAAFLIPLLAFILACGPGQEPTPTATSIPAATATAVPAATPTAAPAASPTPTRPGPVATPTPTSVAVAQPTPTPGKQPQRGGTLRFVTSVFTPNFDLQLLSVTPTFYEANGKLYSNIFVNYEGQNVECEICSDKGWRLENSGKTMVFDIKPGIKFHSGKEMTSADVAYSIKMIVGQVDGIVSPRAGVFKEYFVSVEAPSKYELRINLVRPSVFVPKILAVASAAIYEDGTTRDSLKVKDSGSGPFLVKEIVSGASWELQRNPNYFKPGQPYLDGFKITFVADANTRTASFLTHSIDYAGISDKQYEKQLTQLEKDGKVARALDLGGCGTLFVNMNNSKPPFNELKMRQAVNLALDRTALATVGMGNYIQGWAPSVLFYNPGQEYATPNEKLWNVIPGWGTGDKKKQEIEQAKKLVVDAGYPKGIDLEQMARSPLITYAYLAPELVQQQLGDVGIRTTIKLADATQQAERTANLDFVLQAYQYCMTTRDPDEVIGQYWITGGARNWQGYSNPQVDKLFVQMSAEPDPVKRKDLFFQIQDIIIVKDVGFAPYPAFDGLAWTWSNLHGFTVGMSLHSATGWHRADRVWFDPPQ